MLDTFVAVASDLLFFPACSAYGVDVTSGQKLLFITLRTFSTTFLSAGCGKSFLRILVICGAVNGAYCVFECIIANTMDLWGLAERRPAL